LLLKHGADINMTTKTGSSAIDAAAEAGHEELVMLLLDGGLE
jgi:ankyrin repeat protein